MWRTAAITVVLTLLSTGAEGQARLTPKGEPLDCALWTKEGRRDPMRLGVINFVRAYFTKVSGRGDLLKGKSNRAVGRFLDDYCDANPGESVERALDALKATLKADLPA